MKLVCYIKEGHEQLAMLVNDILYDTDALHPELPSTMSMFLNYWEDYFPLAKNINESIEQGKVSLTKGVPMQSAVLLSPVPIPSSCRNAFAFEENELKAPPVFYFTSHHNVQAPGDISCMPDHLDKLSFQPGVGIVICMHGRNIIASEADRYIGGYLLWNVISSGSLQADTSGSHRPRNAVATVLGPWLVTPDELESFIVPAKDGHTGTNYNLTMKCGVNSNQLIQGNLADMDYTFAEIIESCAYGADLQSGDIIGCSFIKTRDGQSNHQAGEPANTENREHWLQKGNIIELEIEGLGISTSTITAEDSEFSLLRREV